MVTIPFYVINPLKFEKKRRVSASIENNVEFSNWISFCNFGFKIDISTAKQYKLISIWTLLLRTFMNNNHSGSTTLAVFYREALLLDDIYSILKVCKLLTMKLLPLQRFSCLQQSSPAHQVVVVPNTQFRTASREAVQVNLKKQLLCCTSACHQN